MKIQEPAPISLSKKLTNQKNNAKSQERQVAKEYKLAGFSKARRVPSSGAISTLPGDVDPQEDLMVECKMTRRGQLIIKDDWLNKIEDEANRMGRRWFALHAWIASKTGRYKKLVVVPEEYWLEVLEKAKKYDSG